LNSGRNILPIASNFANKYLNMTASEKMQNILTIRESSLGKEENLL